AYDIYGNPTTVTSYGDYDVTGDERTTVTSYVPNTTAYIVSLPAYVNVYAGVGTGGTLMKQTLSQYDGATSYTIAPTRGDLTKTRAWNNQTGGYSDVSHGYDTRGNMTSTTDPLNHTATMGFDSTYFVFPTSTCNALNQCTTQTWDTLLGVK